MRFTAISSVLFLASTVYGSVVPCLDCVTKVTDKTGISATVNAGTTIVGCAFDAAAGVKTGVVNLPIGKTVTVEQVTAYVVSGAVIQADLSYNLAHYLLSQAVFAGLVASETSIDLICNAAYEAGADAIRAPTLTSILLLSSPLYWHTPPQPTRSRRRRYRTMLPPLAPSSARSFLYFDSYYRAMLSRKIG